MIRPRKRSLRKWQTWLINEKELKKDFKKYFRIKIIRKIPKSDTLVNSHLNKAFHNLDFASFTLKNQNKINKRINEETYSDWIIIVSYYAMYHSALAMIHSLGYKSSNHLATICIFM